MIMHVAEAGEQRGRVVLHLAGSHPSPVALEAAVRIARAFNSEIESLFVENAHLFEMTSYPFAREISRFGAQSHALSRDRLEREMRLLAQSLCRRVETLARAAEVPAHARVVRDDPLQALARACAECGPWNVVALADPLSPGDALSLSEVFTTVVDVTGLMLVGPQARRTSGPIVAALEDIEHLQHLVRAGERLASIAGGEIALLLLAQTADEARVMEDHARLALGNPSGLRIMAMAGLDIAPAALAEKLRRMSAGFVIGQYGGILIADDSELRTLVGALECPLFVMR